jgi:hypothetical protein
MECGRAYVDDGILEYDNAHAVDEDCALNSSLSLLVCTVFELPALSSLVEFEAWIVITFV